MYDIDMDSPSIYHIARKVFELSDYSVTPLKLQKLAYYCQAWSLVWKEEPLFSEDFQAWANGPVNPGLYAKHKGEYKLTNDFLSEYSNYEFDEDDDYTIKTVFGFYGAKESFELSELTHKERPWRDARAGVPLGAPSQAIITKDSMQDYYTGISTA